MTPRLRTLLFATAVILSLIILFRPGGTGPLPFAYADKVIHAVTFGLLAITAWWRFKPTKYISLGLIVYALGSEVIQEFFIPGRGFDALDILADLAGSFAILGAVRKRL